MQHSKTSKGFIALTLVLMVASTLLALVYTRAIDTALFYDQATRKEYRTMSYYYARACLDQAILNLAHDYFYTVSSPRSISEYFCSIVSVTASGSERSISTQGNYKNIIVNSSALIRLHDNFLEIVSIE